MVSSRSELRQSAMERAEGRCEYPTCQQHSRLEMAHIWPSGMGGDPKGARDDLGNVWMLCKPCHDHFDGRSPQRVHEWRLLAAAYVALLPVPGEVVDSAFH